MPWRNVTVNLTTDEIAGYNPRRRSMSIANNGTATVFYSQDPANVLTQGFPLGVGQVATFVRDEGDEPEAALYATTTLAGQDVRVEESVGAP